MSERQTVTGAYAKIESHEELCAERYRNIHSALEDLKGGIEGHRKTAQWVLRTFVAAAVAVIGWMAAQLYTHATQQAEPTPYTIEPG